MFRENIEVFKRKSVFADALIVAVCFLAAFYIRHRNKIDFDKWMQLSLQYLDNWSLWPDLKILVNTIPVVLLGMGAF
jgi:hypothetical protein